LASNSDEQPAAACDQTGNPARSTGGVFFWRYPDEEINVTAEQQITTASYNRPLSIAAMTIIGLAGSSIAIIIPSLIDALSRYRGLDTSAAASVMSGEMLGMTVSTAIVASVVRRFDRRSIVVLGIAICALANLGCMAPVHDASALYALRFAAGFGEGALIAAVAAALGGTSQPERNFALFVACNMLLSAVLFRLLPGILSGFGINGLFATLLALLVAAAAALPIFPGTAPAGLAEAPDAVKPDQGRFNPTVLLALLGVLVFFTASGMIWPLMRYFAEIFQIPSESVAGTLSNATLVGMLAAMLATFLGGRWGRSAPLLVAAVLLIGCMVALAGLGAGAFAAAAAIFMGAYMFSTPYYYATLAAADTTGRAVAFSMSVQFFGLTMGPLIGPRFSEYAHGFGAIWAGVGLMVVAVALISMAGSRLRS
jgi:MFS transporter, DHA1 family, inner membrane transport protein